jgi:hypothetical protein
MKSVPDRYFGGVMLMGSMSPTRSKMPVLISASKLSASGPTSPFCAPPPHSLGCARSSPYGHMTSLPTRRSLPRLPPGTQSHTAPSAMPSPQCANRSGIIRLLACPGDQPMSSIFPASYGNEPQTLSPMPRNSIKSSSGDCWLTRGSRSC